MQTNQSIINIAERAALVGLSLSALCLEAGVAYSTVRRWQLKRNSPTLRTIEKIYAQLDAVLARRERQVLTDLSARYTVSDEYDVSS